MSDVDFAGPLVRLDKAISEIYPATANGQWKDAFLYALKAQEELTRFMAMCVNHKVRKP
jgi:hypothetical protein